MLITNPNFRPGTQTEPRDVIFSMMMENETSAALGDMIAWMPALIYTAKTYDYVNGHLIVPLYFLPIAQNLMKPFSNWSVYTEIPDRFANGTQIKRPMPHPINATGMHLVDLGFLYFLGIVPPPEGSDVYPVLDLTGIQSPIAKAENYVVMTPGATTVTRQMPPSVFNKICQELTSRNVTPVFLGDAKMKGRTIIFDERYDLSLGINLIGKTTLLKAARIMKDAKAVIGIDNGLLHLAAMTDVPIVYGFTMTGPTQRRINRIAGSTVEIYANKKDVPCLFCQEHVRFFVDHHFTNCIYKENEPKCVKALNAESWLINLEPILKGKYDRRSLN